jgi:hypothetical protein
MIVNTLGKTVVLSCLLLTLAGAALAQPAEIKLPQEPTARQTVELQEVWRRGGEDDEEMLLGVVSGGVMDDRGYTYLLDRQLCQVNVLAADGEFVGTLGRQGEGPGEINRPTDLFLMDEGRVAVTQGFPGKIIILNPDDTPGGTINVGGDAVEGGFFFMGRGTMRGDDLVVHSGRGTFDREAGKRSSVTTLTRIDRQGNELARFVEHSQEQDFRKPTFDEKANFSELGTWALGDGVLYTHPTRDEYRINAYDLEGKLQRVITRDFQTRVRTEAEKEEVGQNFRMRRNGRRIQVERKVLDTEPAIFVMRVADDGRLFVGNSHNHRDHLDAGVGGVYDVIAPDGKSWSQLTLAVPEFNKDQDRLLFIEGKHWLLLRNFDSAQEAMQAGFGGGDEGDAGDEDLGDAEPLEVVLYAMPD